MVVRVIFNQLNYILHITDNNTITLQSGLNIITKILDSTTDGNVPPQNYWQKLGKWPFCNALSQNVCHSRLALTADDIMFRFQSVNAQKKVEMSEPLCIGIVQNTVVYTNNIHWLLTRRLPVKKQIIEEIISNIERKATTKLFLKNKIFSDLCLVAGLWEWLLWFLRQNYLRW